MNKNFMDKLLKTEDVLSATSREYIKSIFTSIFLNTRLNIKDIDNILDNAIEDGTGKEALVISLSNATFTMDLTDNDLKLSYKENVHDEATTSEVLKFTEEMDIEKKLNRLLVEITA